MTEGINNYGPFEDSQKPGDVYMLARALTSLGDAAISDEAELSVSPIVKVDRREDVVDDSDQKRWVGGAKVVSANPRRLIGKGGEASVTRTPDGRTIFREEVPTLRGGKVVREVVVSPQSSRGASSITASVGVSTARYDRKGRLLKSPTRARGSDEMSHGSHSYLTGRDRSREYEGHIDRGLTRTAGRIAKRVATKLGHTEKHRSKKPYPGLLPNNTVPRAAKRSLGSVYEKRPIAKKR